MSLPGWTILLKIAYQRADIVYSRLNGTILAYDYVKYPRNPAIIRGPDLLTAFDVALSGKSNYTALDTVLQIIGRASNLPVISLYIWWFFDRLSEIPSGNQATSTRAVTGFQSLLAATIYYCQSKAFAELRGVGYGNQTGIGAGLLSMLPAAEPDVPSYPIERRYAIVVGRGTLIAYATLGGVSLALCFFALVLVSLQSGSENQWERSSFPTLDFGTMYKIQDENKHKISNKNFRNLGKKNGQELILTTSKMYVVPWAGSEPDE